MIFFTQEKGTLLPEKGHLAKLGGPAPPPPGSYAPARTPYTAPVILHQNCKDYLTLTVRIGGIKIKSKFVRNLYAGNEDSMMLILLLVNVYYLN